MGKADMFHTISETKLSVFIRGHWVNYSETSTMYREIWPGDLVRKVDAYEYTDEMGTTYKGFTQGDDRKRVGIIVVSKFYARQFDMTKRPIEPRWFGVMWS